eukprot:COSAG02_NODE_29242_length_573_cov_1.040084_1_plen_44_part_01
MAGISLFRAISVAKEYRQKFVALDEKRKNSSPTKTKVQLTSKDY